jgi:hypothetical protein
VRSPRPAGIAKIAGNWPSAISTMNPSPNTRYDLWLSAVAGDRECPTNWLDQPDSAQAEGNSAGSTTTARKKPWLNLLATNPAPKLQQRLLRTNAQAKLGACPLGNQACRQSSSTVPRLARRATPIHAGFGIFSLPNLHRAALPNDDRKIPPLTGAAKDRSPPHPCGRNDPGE